MKMKAILFDTETTGLIKNRKLPLDEQPEIIEFYGCLANLKTGKVLDELEILIKPKRSISEKITKITGINNEAVMECSYFKNHYDRILNFLFRKDSKATIAHNFSYDKDMIEIEFERIGGVKHDWINPICTIEQTMHLQGYRLNLSNLHNELFNEAFKGAHRAKEDVMALLRCCVELHKRKMI